MRPGKWCALGALVLALLFLAGCTSLQPQNIQELLRAPVMGREIGEIQRALSDYLGEEPQYKFPKEGEERSPFVLQDLDGDGNHEAVLFYSLTSVTVETTNMFMAVLLENENGWYVVQNWEGMGSELASVNVVSLYGDNTKQLVIGYANANMSSRRLGIYWFENGAMRGSRSNEEYYLNVLIGDFTGTGRIDIAVASRTADEEEPRVQINFYSGTVDENGTRTLGAVQAPVKLHLTFTNCLGLYPSKGVDGARYLVMDGQLESGLVASQILNYSGSTEGYYAPDTGVAEFVSETSRYTSMLTARDVNGDGIIEIPLDEESYISTPSGNSKLKITRWYNFFEEEPVLCQFGMLDSNHGVYVRLPDQWQSELAYERYQIQDGDTRGLWRIQNSRTGEILLELRELASGEIPPGEDKRIPGATDLYFFPGEGLNVSQRSQIRVISLT